MADGTTKGRALGAGSGAATDLTAAQQAAIIGSVGGATKSKLLSFTRDLSAANGDADYTGFGFLPTSIEAFGALPSPNLTSYATLNGMADSGGCRRRDVSRRDDDRHKPVPPHILRSIRGA